MESPFLDLDIEAQTNNVTGSLPAINIESPSPTTQRANLQLPITSELQHEHKNPDQYHYENAASRKATDDSGIQRGMLTFLFRFYKLWFSSSYQTRTMETLLMGCGRCTSLRQKSRIKRSLRVGRETQTESSYL